METLNNLFDEILKKIRVQNNFNPFHLSFSEDNIKMIIREVVRMVTFEPVMNEEKKETIRRILDLCKATVLMNNFCQQFYAHLKKLVLDSNLSRRELADFLFAAVNRNYMLVQQEVCDTMKTNATEGKGQKEFYFIQTPDFKVRSADESLPDMNAAEALEAAVDSLNIVINYLKHCPDKDSTVDPVIRESIWGGTILNLFRTGNGIAILKHDYEEAVWNEGFFVLEERKLIIDFFSHRELKLKFTSQRVMHQKVISEYMNLMANYYEYPFKVKKHIQKCYIENGYVKYLLSDGVDKNEMAHGAACQASLNAYYVFLENVSFPMHKELDIKKALFMFDLLSYLFYVVSRLGIKELSWTGKASIDFYPFRITKNDMQEYLKERTDFNSGEINSFLSLLENENSHLNLWDAPLLPKGPDYLFALLPLISSVPYNLIDCWLKKGGISLDKRGKHLEIYLTRKLKSGETACPFPYTVINQKNFKKAEGAEIDLLIKMNNTLIVAELKCIRYPMEVRDYHNALKRLKEGCEKLREKMGFLKREHEVLRNVIGEYENKTMVGVVITNYPLFSGFSRNNIPIVDAHVFEAYFTGGTIFKKRCFKEEEQYINQIDDVRLLYATDEEFNKNIIRYLQNPPIVEMALKYTHVNYMKRMPDKPDFNIYTASADM